MSDESAVLKPGDVLTTEEAAELLKVTPLCVQAWRKRGTGPAYISAPGARPRYLRSDLLAWLNANRVEPINNP